jgi:hypothetical protein
LSCSLAFFSVGLARVDDIWATAVAERPRDGRKTINRFIDKLQSLSEKRAYPIAVTFSWKFEGPNGLPAKPDELTGGGPALLYP